MTDKESVKSIFEDKIAERAPKATDIDAIFFFDITGDDPGKWIVDLTDTGEVRPATGDEKADCTIEMDAGDFKDLVYGRQNGQMLFMAGKLTVSGNMGLALKLGQLVQG